MPSNRRTFFPEIHTDFRKVREINRLEAERIKQEQSHVLTPEQEQTVAIWRKKIAISNSFQTKNRGEPSSPERRGHFKKLLADYSGNKHNHSKEFADEIVLFLQKRKEYFVHSAV